MNKEKLSDFIKLFDEIKGSDSYKARKEQFKITPVFKEIVAEVLKNRQITNQHLTDLIQIFKYNCTDDNFDNKLEACVKDVKKRKEIKDARYKIYEPGYTNAGKTGVTGLNNDQLDIVKRFLVDAFSIETIEDAVLLCRNFDSEKIPQVTKGIYSPWLYYINPQVFPIVNNTHKYFKNWLELSDDYSTSVEEYSTLNKLVGELELGELDTFAYHFTKEGKLSYRKNLFLNGKRLYKMSHGFFKKGELWNSGIIELLEEKNWICIYEDTGKSQGDKFANQANIGDYVYLCYGGDDLVCFGKIISESKRVDRNTDKLIHNDGKWIYREIEVLYSPMEKNIRDLKEYKSQTMPSGNSTFWEVKAENLEQINEVLFIPKFNIEVHFTEEENTENKSEVASENNYKMNNNTILYGPPGTGKTYHSISHAVAIIEGKDFETIVQECEIGNRDDVRGRYEKYVEKGRIHFCTFHQSMNYEDFIEGIKPLKPKENDPHLKYDIVDGIFKSLCNQSSDSLYGINIAFTAALTGSSIPTRTQSQIYDDYISTKPIGNILKSRMGKKYEIMQANGTEIIIANDHKDDATFSREVVIKGIDYYSAMIKAPKIKDVHDDIRSLDTSIFDALIRAVLELHNNANNGEIINKPPDTDRFVLIIDEINRGNVSQIFGELITLIEEDKRLGKDEAITVTLPYSREEFGVPPNLYIIGTMNTADRSIEALDTALRRRFTFIPMLAEVAKLEPTNDGIDLPKMLQKLNDRLKILKDLDHTIGHAWLMGIEDLAGLKKAFVNKILPLLQEYFYNDYEKLGLLLGESFFKPSITIDDNAFPKFFNSSLSSQYENTEKYELKDPYDLDIKAFQSIYQ